MYPGTEEEKRVYCKINCTILRKMCVVFLHQYLDKQSQLRLRVRPHNRHEHDQRQILMVYIHVRWPAGHLFIYLMSRLHLTNFVGDTFISLAIPFVTDKWHIITWSIICMYLAAAGVSFYLIMPRGLGDCWFITARREGGAVTTHDAGPRERGQDVVLDAEAQGGKAWFVFAFGVLVTMQSVTSAHDTPHSSWIDSRRRRPNPLQELAMSTCAYLSAVDRRRGVLAVPKQPYASGLVVLALIIPPFVGNALLLKLALDSGWGMIVASWLASCITAVMSPLVLLAASNVEGNTKRSLEDALFFIG
ncbi:pantothenate transporter [Apiospora kogelbergensis]|uniref:pantothenate transporter n=1 Tax=Apiospora kogelbergensis TaxID=1337665 RepID=UPI00312F857C